MPEVEMIKALFDVGGVVVVTVMLWVVWKRLGDTTDKLIEILWELRLRETESLGSAHNSGKPKENES